MAARAAYFLTAVVSLTLGTATVQNLQDSCTRSSPETPLDDVLCTTEPSDLVAMMQMQRGRGGLTNLRIDTSVGEGDPPISLGEERDIALAKASAEMFFPPSPHSRDLKCNHMQTIDCMNQTIRNMCPTDCRTENDMLSIVESRFRGHSAGSLQARSRVVSRMQTITEKRWKQLKGGKNMPKWIHKALIAFDGALESVKKCPKKRNTNPHLTELGYPLTVVETIMFQLNLTDLIVNIPRDTTHAKLYLNFAEVIEEYGWDSKQAKDFYEKALYLTGEHALPVDAGWLNEFLATMGTYAFDLGIHTYRKCAWNFFPPGYNYDFSVYKLNDNKIKIGLIADWAAGSPQTLQLIQEMKKQDVNMVIHLGDTYYSGEEAEARMFFLEPLQAVFGKQLPLYQVPGNHDYYSGGEGFFKIIDELGNQEASFFCLRGNHWQIIALDTGLLDNFQLLFSIGDNPEMEKAMQTTLTFLPEDQADWARHQLDFGIKHGLKTIVMSHHQYFSRREAMGDANGFAFELSTMPDRLKYTYFTDQFKIKSEDLPGNLPAGTKPTLNTRLLNQLGAERMANISAWFWGHEHASSIFKPYGGLERGRLIGNGAIGEPLTYDLYAESNELEGNPWGGHPQIISGSEIGKGNAFWNLGFTTLLLEGKNAKAEYFEMQDVYIPPNPPSWLPARRFFEETF